MRIFQHRINFSIVLFIAFLIVDAYSGIASDTLNLQEYVNEGVKYKYVNNDSSSFYFKKALNIAESNALTERKVKILLSLIEIEIINGNPLQAIQFVDTVISISNKNGYDDEYLTALIYRGNIYQVAGLTSEALQFLLEIESLFSTTFKKTNENYQDLNLLIASAYQGINETQKAIEYLNKNINLQKTNPSKIKLAGTYILLANLNYNPDSIILYLDMAEGIVKNNPNTINEYLVILNNKALANKSLGNLEKSKSIYNEAIRTAKAHGYRPYLANLFNNYAYQLMAEKNMDSVEIILDEALLISKQIGDVDLEASILDTYSDYFAEIDEFSTALDYKNYSIAKRNEYREKQQIQQSLFLSTVFETEQKEKEIIKQQSQLNRFQAILFGSLALILLLLGIVFYYRQKSTIRKARLIAADQEKTIEVANALIEGQDTERKRLAMDLHDGLGARLGTLRFKLDGVLDKNPSKEEIGTDIDDIGRNIRELSHRMLPTQLTEFGLIYSLKSLFSSLSNSTSFKLELESDLEERLPLKFETQIYYLVYEMINNALKHSGGDQIFVQLINHESTLSLSVEDNGKGFDQEKVGDGLGIKNIKQRISYLGGEIHIESQENRGSIFMIEIPVQTND